MTAHGVVGARTRNVTALVVMGVGEQLAGLGEPFGVVLPLSAAKLVTIGDRDETSFM